MSNISDRQLAETLFGSVVNPFTPGEDTIGEGLECLNNPLILDKDTVAYAYCRFCTRAFHVTAERAKQILGTDQFPDKSEYIEVLRCTECNDDAYGARILPNPFITQENIGN